jgi:hypothetical protein
VILRSDWQIRIFEAGDFVRPVGDNNTALIIDKGLGEFSIRRIDPSALALESGNMKSVLDRGKSSTNGT